MTTQIVWFKRDLRVVDHRPLFQAAQTGEPVVALYVLEPDLWALPDSSGRHWQFIRDSLIELDQTLRRLGIGLTIRRGEITNVLGDLQTELGACALWSHEETGNGWTYGRDRKVAHWCRTHAVSWTELAQFGVVRRLRNRNGWAGHWDQFMDQPVALIPQLQGPDLAGEALNAKPHAYQIGGRLAGEATLSSFLAGRGENYRAGMASPLTAFDDCSRLSPHLTFGTMSMREVYQAAACCQTLPKRVLESFIGRLHWHCHFIQKLEDQPSIEQHSLHPAYRGLRDGSFDAALFGAYQRGETGYPFVDACLRALTATGYLNFRARAMLVSFASYQLWQPWQETGALLARLFTDYEPGIHWSQIQMQSGTTGINQIRIYNPVKQGLDNDPEGTFIRRWVPELAALSAKDIHEPWKASDAQGLLGKSYPEPIVDLKSATTRARDLVWSVRKTLDFREAANRIQTRHGSRKAGVRRPDKAQRTTSTAAQSSSQGELNF